MNLIVPQVIFLDQQTVVLTALEEPYLVLQLK